LFLIRFVVFNFRESAKFLIIKGRDQEAVNVMRSIAKFNKVDPDSVTISIEDMRAIDSGFAQLSSSEGGSNPLAEAKPKKWYVSIPRDM